MSTTEQQRGNDTVRADRIRAVAARAAELPWEMQRAGDDEESWWRGGKPLAEGVAPITVVNMDTIYEAARSGRCAAAGCLAGLTLTMFPEEARRFWTDKTPSPPLEAARRVLGLDPATAGELFEGNSSGRKLHELGRDQMLHALERAAAGAVGADVWK